MAQHALGIVVGFSLRLTMETSPPRTPPHVGGTVAIARDQETGCRYLPEPFRAGKRQRAGDGPTTCGD